jgi:hypothetical protein
MTDQTTDAAPAADTGGALSAVAIPTTEQIVQDAAKPLNDIKAMAAEIGAHIDAHDVGETASTWLADARSALANAVHYVEQHFKALEDAVKADTKIVEEMFSGSATSTDAAAAAAATAATAI